MRRKSSCWGCDMLIDNTTRFLNTFFFNCDTYSADKIDKMVTPFVIQICLDLDMIETVINDGKRLYHILPEGKRAIGK